MLRPVLLIGVGGSGGKTLRAMRQSLLRKLHQRGWSKDRLPEGWQMLWVDSVSQQDEDAFQAPLLPNTQYLGLVTPGLIYSDLRATLEQSVQPLERQNALAGWVPETVPIAVSAGAGQARAIGRTISAAQLKSLKGKLEEVNARLSGVTVTSELAEVSSLFGQSDESPLTMPLAIVISSVAGGSGSGMFLDVVEALKTVDDDFASPDGIITVLYTPDVFSSIGGAGGQIPPNTLAAIMEVTSGVLSPGLSEASAAVLSSRGLVKHSRHGFGAKCNFLVGASNKNVVLGSQEDVYYAVGESLTAVVTDDKIQQTLRAFTLANVFLMTGNAMIVEDRSRLTEATNTDESMPFSAMGMARLNLGTDRLQDFIGLLVGRDITQALLWPQLEKRRKGDGPVVTNEEHIDAAVAQRWEEFLAASRLNERNPQDDIVEALADKRELEQRLMQWARAQQSKASQGVDEKGMAPTEWAHRLQNQYDNQIEVVKAQELSNVHERAQQWTDSIQSHLVHLISETAIRAGLAVAERLVERLIDEMSYVVTEMSFEASTKRSQTQLMPSSLQQALNVGAGRLSVDDDAVNKATRGLQIGAQLEVDAACLDVAATLAGDVAENLLGPLLTALQFSRARLTESVAAAKLPDGRPTDWPQLPEYDKPVPTQLLQGSTERVLIAPHTFQAVLQEEVQALLKNEKDRQAWRSLLRERAALGRVLDTGTESGSSLFGSSVSWIPKASALTSANVTGVRAEFSLPSHFKDVHAHVAQYVSSPKLTGSVSTFLGQGLADYVESGTPTEQVSRQTAFISALTEAVQISAPFVEVNAAVKSALHPNVDESVQALVSTIPFPEGHPLHGRIKSVLVGGGLWTDTQSPKWFATAKVSSISIFTMTGKAMMPMVFDNIMKPVASSWASNSGNPARRQAFWAMRRARPLREFLPIGPLPLNAMVRGWFLAALLGQRPIKDEGAGGWRVQIWDADDRRMIDFPFPLLHHKGVERNGLPAIVLKSIAIAMVKVNESGSLAPLKPYHRLLDLGTEGKYTEVLHGWIRSGTVDSPGAPVPDEKLAGSIHGSLDERREAVLRTLEKTREMYRQDFSDVAERRNPYTAPPEWELRDAFMAGLSELSAVVETIRDNEDTL